MSPIAGEKYVYYFAGVKAYELRDRERGRERERVIETERDRQTDR